MCMHNLKLDASTRRIHFYLIDIPYRFLTKSLTSTQTFGKFELDDLVGLEIGIMIESSFPSLGSE